VLESEEDAALAYNVKASVVQGEFARLNLVELPYLGYQPQPRRKSSIYKGVCYLRREKRWRGYVDAAGKREVLGEFATEHEAASAVDRRLHA
jgi:hypothetical protein